MLPQNTSCIALSLVSRQCVVRIQDPGVVVSWSGCCLVAVACCKDVRDS